MTHKAKKITLLAHEVETLDMWSYKYIVDKCNIIVTGNNKKLR